ncbi:nucleotidyl transferase AbiEii/AbiGii toxin family protein (plasmid) [Pseudomonas veronii]|uniref:nucleotidyl transferase AbiEii/AbiGii toxin family protein n=1 Tax=Pseudomonas veronii TaxID=76761 RepID=UPI000FD8CBA0|nr:MULTISPECIES: nucleotidyl transferase AbiEii/AbiGii toxin family protein [Pseudomonas]UHH33471.1 nucleotidyl transferase AbiEii/AbiGii toxin family protein [Pseudomonas veronii]
MEIDIEQWVAEAPREFLLARQASHVILRAVASDERLRTSMIIKGGTLLGIRYGSTRATTDIDFSTEKKLSEIDLEVFEKTLNDSMDLVESLLNYGIKCKLQSKKTEPNAQGTFPTIKMKIGYCLRSNAFQMKRLDEKNSPLVIAIDYSFNEQSYNVEMLQFEDEEIQAYDICDLLAEKLRSILQQEVRNRSREQDVYDVNYLLTTINPLTDSEKEKVYNSLIRKSQGKNIDYLLNPNGIDDNDIRRRSKEKYHLLEATVKVLPDFDESYSRVVDFFKSLPWQ